MLKRTLLLATAAAAVLILAAPAAHASTVWLCKPGLAKNPCLPSLKTTLISPTGKTTGTVNVKRQKSPQWDCFYVYPTVSDQKRPQATKHIDPEERSIALYQTAYYSRDCRVYAPMYRQITIQGLLQPDTVTPAMRTSAYNDVRDAFRDYLRRYNKGRGIVLISHSQGTFVLRNLIAKEIDPKPGVRKRLISAALMGGNVLVKKGKTVGGDFKTVPACQSNRQIGCVIAWSTYNE